MNLSETCSPTIHGSSFKYLLGHCILSLVQRCDCEYTNSSLVSNYRDLIECSKTSIRYSYYRVSCDYLPTCCPPWTKWTDCVDGKRTRFRQCFCPQERHPVYEYISAAIFSSPGCYQREMCGLDKPDPEYFLTNWKILKRMLFGNMLLVSALLCLGVMLLIVVAVIVYWHCKRHAGFRRQIQRQSQQVNVDDYEEKVRPPDYPAYLESHMPVEDETNRQSTILYQLQNPKPSPYFT